MVTPILKLLHGSTQAVISKQGRARDKFTYSFRNRREEEVTDLEGTLAIPDTLHVYSPFRKRVPFYLKMPFSWP